MKHSFSSPLLWEDKYPRIVYSHNSAAETGEHSVPRHTDTAGIAPCETAAGKLTGMSHKEFATIR